MKKETIAAEVSWSALSIRGTTASREQTRSSFRYIVRRDGEFITRIVYRVLCVPVERTPRVSTDVVRQTRTTRGVIER